MEVAIATVPFTGTNFTAKIFTDRGYYRANYDEPVEGDVVRVAHCIKPGTVDAAQRLVQDGIPLILTCRHPYRVEESWRRQGRNTRDLIAAFENLIRLSGLTDFFLCVDYDGKREQLAHISESIGIPLDTKWCVINSKSDTHEMTRFMPSQEMFDFAVKHSGFFGRWYDLV